MFSAQNARACYNKKQTEAYEIHMKEVEDILAGIIAEIMDCCAESLEKKFKIHRKYHPALNDLLKTAGYEVECVEGRFDKESYIIVKW